ncbi:ribonuclease H-like domain-containing protein, partial [Schizophyllum commune]
RCFPHVVNLACKAVLAAITNLDFARPNAGPFVPTALHRDAIAIVRTAIRAICASSLRRGYFEEVLAALKQKNLQLLRDVETRWSSTLLMVERAILLRAAIDRITRETPELNKYRFRPDEWTELEELKKVLEVPHAFQQILSGEKMPTLCNAIPSFERMARRWEQLKTELPGMACVIDHGLDKLDEYRDKTDIVPAYIVAMVCIFPLQSRACA